MDEANHIDVPKMALSWYGRNAFIVTFYITRQIVDRFQCKFSLSFPCCVGMEPRIDDHIDEATLQECNALAEKYVENCKRFEVTVDPSVVIALRTGWNILRPSNVYGEGSMLPLMGVLEGNKHITKINLQDVSMKDHRLL